MNTPKNDMFMVMTQYITIINKICIYISIIVLFAYQSHTGGF